ncbi:hypothetical protein P5673_018211 [Acropora cervicornis]|uniref:Uncharacterized protein n=1 Tax=Acropora cervicornis TaxID=6130 RepID=A0AAD9QD31_ACRCE|nr:hypothetical protein P5673_018211 [Acropora cervicornis]
MVADAHLRKLRELNIIKGDATSLMDSARRIKDAKQVLTSINCRYAVRLDNEDMILMLMRKLPGKNGNRLRLLGQVRFGDFLNFIQKRADRLNNHFGQKLKLSLPQYAREGRRARDGQGHPERLRHFVSQHSTTHRRGPSVQDQLPSSAITVLVHLQFGSVRALKVHSLNNDCELDISQRITQRDSLAEARIREETPSPYSSSQLTDHHRP